jgi:benzoyl-CoA 2,3-dioxygenase component B
MLTEEAHHMFVGETASARGKAHPRSDEGTRQRRPGQVRAAGAIDLPTLQKYLNFGARARSTCSARRSPQLGGDFANG